MSTHPLETKDIQESLLGISDFFESVELVPHNAQVSDSARVLLTTIPRRGRFPGPYHESALSNLCLAVYLSCAVLEKVKLRQVDAVTPWKVWSAGVKKSRDWPKYELDRRGVTPPWYPWVS